MQYEAAYLQVMKWDDLRIFLAVARSGQIARAATQLSIDPTTVSRRIRALEASLGATLFEQHSGGQRLTAAGESLVTPAEAVERSVSTIAIDKTAASGPSGLVRVGSPEGFGTWLVAHHLGEFGRSYPSITVELVATRGVLNPTRREADAAVLLARPQRGPLISRKLTDYDLGLYATPAYLAQTTAVARTSDLHDHTLIGYIPDLLYSPELNYLDEVAPNLTARLRSSSINAQYRLSASGAGIAVLPRFIADRDQGLVRVLPELTIQRSFWLVTHKDTRDLPRVRLFTDWLVASVARWRPHLAPASAD